MSKKTEKSKKRVPRERRYRKRQRETGIFFLLWAAFSVLSLVSILLIGGSQRVVLKQTYGAQAAREVSEKGALISREVEKPVPDAFKGDRSAYLHYLSVVYDVNVFILDGQGEVLFPQEPVIDEGETAVFDFSDETKTLLAQLERAGKTSVVYEGDGEYVYGSEISLYERTRYLYVSKSLNLMEATIAQMGVRTLFIAIFVFLLSFAVSSAVAGWLVRPLTEMTEKARKLAHGDFNVDFSGTDYGREMVELADTLNFARDEISKADHMQKELIANVSHDFKTPLTMIKGYALMIMEISGDIPEKRNKHAQVIVDEADRLASLVNDVLDISKIRSGIDGLTISQFDLSEYLHEVLERFAYLCDTQGYTFVKETEERIIVKADKNKIGQALYNLIGNAVNYTGADKTVKITLKRTEGNKARFAVTDTGEGIKNEDLPNIWDRYYRSSETHKRPVKGTGLGLSIVKTVFESHNLEFGVESEVGKGSTFYVLFPMENA